MQVQRKSVTGSDTKGSYNNCDAPGFASCCCCFTCSAVLRCCTIRTGRHCAGEPACDAMFHEQQSLCMPAGAAYIQQQQASAISRQHHENQSPFGSTNKYAPQSSFRRAIVRSCLATCQKRRSKMRNCEAVVGSIG